MQQTQTFDLAPPAGKHIPIWSRSTFQYQFVNRLTSMAPKSVRN